MRSALLSRLPLAATVLGLALAGPAHAQYQYQAQYQPPAPTRAPTQGEEVLFSVLATAANIFYTPLKVVIAAIAMPAGGFAGAAAGGDARTAYAIWVPALGGTFFLTNAHLDGSKPIEFFGSDYADRPLPQRKGEDETLIFDNAATGVYSRGTTSTSGSGAMQTYGSVYR
jgi:hypothetical protein